MPGFERLERTPVVLTKTEALELAAGYLEGQAGALRMTSVIVAAITADDLKRLEPGKRKIVELIRSKSVEPELQIAAMRSAAAAIRQTALEERIVSARVAKQQEKAG